MSYQSDAIRNLVELHETEMRKLLEVWRAAKRCNLDLPKTDDPAYTSLEALLRHPLRAARGYLTWTCEVLDRPAPEIPAAPEEDRVAEEADRYLDIVLAAWREHLAWMPDDVEGSDKQYPARWKWPYTIDQMLEHAVMHPMRHRRQLERLMAA